MESGLQNTLEEMVDKHTLWGVLDALSETCKLRAEHVRTNLRDEVLARKWEHYAYHLDKLCTKIHCDPV